MGQVTLCGGSAEHSLWPLPPTPAVTHFPLLFLGYKWQVCNPPSANAESDPNNRSGSLSQVTCPPGSGHLTSAPCSCVQPQWSMGCLVGDTL